MGLSTLAKKVALSMQALTLMFGFGVSTVAVTAALPAPAYAAPGDCSDPSAADPLAAGAACGQAAGTRDNLFAPGGIFQVVSNTLIFLVGAVSVIFLIIGGLRYVISQGDSKNVTAAKDTILYAIIGLVVAVISFALVNFVITSLNKAQ
jgi:hypothetical protein